jgi:hypothetical protein
MNDHCRRKPEQNSAYWPLRRRALFSTAEPIALAPVVVDVDVDVDVDVGDLERKSGIVLT